MRLKNPRELAKRTSQIMKSTYKNSNGYWYYVVEKEQTYPASCMTPACSHDK